ncbi:error-prone DNA polymerase [Alteromonas sp. ASW11-19]|uniref:Error-prone DNA polymerase n=1 Tax=Alteromonas salexigens TaxID=2982530 RepID=A0ABT2VNE9_9ALTE|nr:error-prone DNA polymerase [Alteromonas salexigens]MCU7554826.1 error-prone DNA polymerase [Alteromonas salexigens]
MISELFCQSNFSFLTGASSPEELVTTASFLGYQSLALTDECSVAGVVRAYAEIKRSNLPVNLIVGSFFRYHKFEFVLLCPTRSAYSELCRIITQARRRADKGEYILEEWDLASIRHCLILWLPSGNAETDNERADWLVRFHAQRCWIAAQRLLDGADHERFENYTRLSQTYTLPVVACTGVLMHHRDRLPTQHVLHAIRERTTVAKLGQHALANAERALRPAQKMRKLYPADWIQTASELAGQCHFSLQELKYQYPAELVPAGHTPGSYLRECVEAGIQRRFPEGVSEDIRALIEKELTLIAEQQYEYFFLTLYDIVQFAQSQSILYQGRGSAANSVVCYCLEITAVDPRQINVLFERFISKERDEPPDIDVDFEHERREEVIQYIYQKYGRERTALAATVICYRFKSAFRDVGKALGFAESQLSYIITKINRRDRTIPWQSQLSKLGLAPDNPAVKQLVVLVESLLGFPRHLSQHVGGFVISSGPLHELVPIENASMPERTVIQWDKDDLETLGLLKVDVLALGMLTAIRKTFDYLKARYPVAPDIPFITRLGDDPQVYDMICEADTVGVFQIESRAQMSMLPRLRPRCYYDLVVQIAIVRPGPIQGDMVHPYLLRRHGREPVSYPSDAVAGVLSRTMGVPIFQEQVIQLAMVAAGFSGGEADQLRRAMASWKKDGRIYEFRDKLVRGMQQKGYDEAYATQVFEQIKGFGGYGFPESHSASFAVLAYVSCWLKHYFPAEFYTGLLNSWPMGFYTPSQLIQDARRHNIEVRPVCVNHSDYDHSLEQHQQNVAIRLGLRLVKGLSEQGARQVASCRPEHGYTSVNALNHLGLHRDDMEALASADALRAFGNNRYAARWELMDTQRSLPLFEEQNGYSTFALTPSKSDSLVEDYAATSVSLNAHPIGLLREYHDFSKLTSASQLSQVPNKGVVHVIGCVTGRQAPGTASGVTFLTLEDDTGNINTVIWQATARAQQAAYLNASILQVDGILERSPEGVIHVIAGKLTDRSAWLDNLHVPSRDFH